MPSLSSPQTSTYMVPSVMFGSASPGTPKRSRSCSTNSAAASACSSSSSSEASPAPAPFSRTRTTASAAPRRRKPDLGSWTISTSASCSLTPSSARAASRASSTLAPLLSTSRIPASARSALLLGRRRACPAALRCPARLSRRPRGRSSRTTTLALAAGPLGLGPLEHRGEESAAGRRGWRRGPARRRGPRGLAVTRLAVPGPLVVEQRLLHVAGTKQEVLLPDLDQVRRGPVQDHAGGNDEPPEDRDQRQDPP